MAEHLLVGLATIIVLGIGAQWIAWRFSTPAILLLLVSGFIAGPITGFIDTDLLFGNLLLPIVSVAVAVILFEGGLSLKLSEVKGTSAVVRNLVTVGVLVTWIASSAASYYILGFQFQLSILLGAVLVVTGPTVIIPLLRDVRPSGRIGSIIKWEGIVIDPIGAVLAVLVFEAILAGGPGEATEQVAYSIIKTVILGSAFGIAGAFTVLQLFKRHWVPDFLQNPVALMVVIAVFTLSNSFQTESGLLTVTLMGILLANQKSVSMKHIVEFKENLRVLFISSLFIILAARLKLEDLKAVLTLESLLFLLVLILLIRPLCVLVSTLYSDLKLNDKLFLSWMAPRGIVAAAVSAVFALRLSEAGIPGAERLIDMTFLVITVTVAIYGLTARPLAKRLGLAKANPQGFLIVGAHKWARALARFLHENGVQVVLVDSNWSNVAAARQDGIRSYYENILLEETTEDIDLDGIGRLLALTPNDEVNSLAALHFIEFFGRSQVYQLPKHSKFRTRNEESIPKHLRGRLLFREDCVYSYMSERFEAGAVLKKTKLNHEFDFNAFLSLYGETAVPMFLIRENGEISVFATDNKPTPMPGQQIIALVDEVKEEGSPNNNERE